MPSNFSKKFTWNDWSPLKPTLKPPETLWNYSETYLMLTWKHVKPPKSSAACLEFFETLPNALKSAWSSSESAWSPLKPTRTLLKSSGSSWNLIKLAWTSLKLLQTPWNISKPSCSALEILRNPRNIPRIPLKRLKTFLKPPWSVTWMHMQFRNASEPPFGTPAMFPNNSITALKPP